MEVIFSTGGCALKIALSLFVCFNGSTFKMMKNAFYFILKALFVLKNLTFWSCRKNGFIKGIRLSSKFMMLQTG